MKENNIIIGVVVLLFAVGGVLYALGDNGGASTGGGVADVAKAELAQCLKDSGTVFYGAFWCPHCKSQKALFGSAVKSLPYVECSTPDGKSQTSLCASKEISSYPTWVFPDGTSQTGEVPLADLATKSGCKWGDAPVNESASASTTVVDVAPEASTTPV